MAGLYIHIPFCRSKCAYCDFYSGPIGQGRENEYVEAIIEEWDLRKAELENCPINTLYLGGGTPSLLPLSILQKLLTGLKLDLSQIGEATIEANPEDITSQWLKEIQQLGINRISIGIQSFSEKELAILGRSHCPKDALAALEVLSASGMNYSADLIYGIPGQDLSDWETNLTRLLSFQPPHFSAYFLSYEPGTRLTSRLCNGKISEIAEEVGTNMYQLLCSRGAEKGYEHYEISNFGLAGYHSLHNSAYWKLIPYLGLGAAAHSYTKNLRRYNPSSLNDYLSTLKSGKTAYLTEEETPENSINDYIITSLRTAEGLDYNLLSKKFDYSLSNRLLSSAQPFLAHGLLTSTPSGFRIPESYWLIADSILRELIL